MTDVHDKKTRSYNMSRIKSKNTKPEILVRKHLHSLGFRFRLHLSELPGKPDIYLRKYKTVIFVNGCFWHGHAKCKYFTLPKTRTEWWKNKIEKNQLNDSISKRKLVKMGLKVIVIWECELKADKIENTFNTLLHKLRF